ncbi:MAG: hypothetical protein AB1411_13195 [Nitrospirota bacterium]
MAALNRVSRAFRTDPDDAGRIAQLTASIEGLDKRMPDLERPPDRAGSTFNDLQALDLSAWRLRRQQWVLQRDHLELARELLRQAAESPDQRARLGEQWADHALLRA